MPVSARNLIRKMRGGAQSHLLACEDGEYYVVKFTNNPQHRRILVNEWLANSFLRYLQIHVPQTALIRVSEEFLAKNPEVYFTVGSRRERIVPGIHFGSRMSVNPDKVAIFDFLPEKLLDKVENRVEFLGALVFDKWVGNSDSRQAVFFRARAKTWTPLKGDAPAKVGFFAQMIDHGYAFNGPHWEFNDTPLNGLYFRTSVYQGVTSLDSFQPWLDMVTNFPIEAIDSAWKEIPREWLDQDEDALEKLLETLLKRRGRVVQLIEDVHRKRASAFPNWR
jgi:hypothetical protein